MVGGFARDAPKGFENFIQKVAIIEVSDSGEDFHVNMSLSRQNNL